MGKLIQLYLVFVGEFLVCMQFNAKIKQNKTKQKKTKNKQTKKTKNKNKKKKKKKTDPVQTLYSVSSAESAKKLKWLSLSLDKSI